MAGSVVLDVTTNSKQLGLISVALFGYELLDRLPESSF